MNENEQQQKKNKGLQITTNKYTCNQPIYARKQCCSLMYHKSVGGVNWKIKTSGNKGKSREKKQRIHKTF